MDLGASLVSTPMKCVILNSNSACVSSFSLVWSTNEHLLEAS